MVAMNRGSMLPSIILDGYLPSSEADRFSTASGKRALRGEVIAGLMSRTCRIIVYTLAGMSRNNVSLSLTNRRCAITEIVR